MLERIQKVFRDYKCDDSLVITEETTFAGIGLDSLDTVELVMNLEDEFGVTIKLDGGVKSVGDLMKVIENAQ